MKILQFLLFISLIVFSSCKKDHADTVEPNPPKDKEELPVTTTPQPQKSYLVSASLRSHFTKEQLQAVASMAGYGELTMKIKSGASTYFVEYLTVYKGAEVKASGLVHIPDSVSSSTKLLSFQHGTEFLKSRAPSSNTAGSPTILLASTGYITFEPDYLGYGSSSNLFHPYYDKTYSASTVIDLIKAGKEYLKKENKSYKNQLFLAGYSEGGYVTLAAHEAIEKSHSSDIKLGAVAAGAGGYDLNEMLEGLTETSFYSYPAYLAFIIHSFEATYGWNNPASYYFASPYAEKFPALIDGSTSGSDINSQLTTDLDLLLNPTFYNNIKTGGEPRFKEKLSNNSIIGWKNAAPLRLYHGTADEIIPIDNSQTVYNTMLNAGGNVSFFPIQGGTHGSSSKAMVVDFLNWFETIE